jgi:hypothetical protein
VDNDAASARLETPGGNVDSTVAANELELPADHPGVSDPAYRRRRAAIAAVGETYRAGEPIPDVTYAPEEDEVWRTVSPPGSSRCPETASLSSVPPPDASPS